MDLVTKKRGLEKKKGVLIKLDMREHPFGGKNVLKRERTDVQRTVKVKKREKEENAKSKKKSAENGWECICDECKARDVEITKSRSK